MRIDRLEACIGDCAALTRAWRKADLLIEDDDFGNVVRIRVGAPDLAALDTVKDVPELHALLRRFNGIAIGADEEEGCDVVAPIDLHEPEIWPAGRRDVDMLRDADLVEGISLRIIGQRGDSGWLALGLSDDGPEPVFWVDSEFSVVAPHVIADSLSDFVDRWCDASLSVPLLLRNARVPGWCG